MGQKNLFFILFQSSKKRKFLKRTKNIFVFVEVCFSQIKFFKLHTISKLDIFFFVFKIFTKLCIFLLKHLVTKKHTNFQIKILFEKYFFFTYTCFNYSTKHNKNFSCIKKYNFISIY